MADHGDPGRRLHRYGGDASVFETSEVDDASAVQYYGYVNCEGAWLISKYDTGASPKTMRYATGKQDYATNWSNRASLSYDYYHVAFKPINPIV